MSMLLLPVFVLIGSLGIFPGVGLGEVFITPNIKFEVLGCQVLSYKKDSPYGFDTSKLFDEDEEKTFETEEKIGFNIAILVNEIVKDVQVEWTLFWFRPDKTGEGIKYSGFIKEEASPQNFGTGLYLENQLGERKSVIPLFVRAKRSFRVLRGNYEVALFQFLVDGKEFDFKKTCHASYLIE